METEKKTLSAEQEALHTQILTDLRSMFQKIKLLLPKKLSLNMILTIANTQNHSAFTARISLSAFWL